VAFSLRFTNQAKADLADLLRDPSPAQRLRAVHTLGCLERDPRHPGLHTHPYSQLSGPNQQRVYEAYAQNRSPTPLRVFWSYGPGGDEITIVAITAHVQASPP
jgi:hypothetical protein